LTEFRQFSNSWKFSLFRSWLFLAYSMALGERHNGNYTVSENVRNIQNLTVLSSCELPLEVLRKITKNFTSVLGTETTRGISRTRRSLMAASDVRFVVDRDSLVY
jgi:hypothetical protein